ncbi:IMH3 [Symbiodinium pilosum]|uniref:IMH3 protein n=1 Tax=Symbiodinium pilosum TaxID=2952 RepID=A0A812R194_SYMPI|nr:IMH3 [Symbiodinium pilosum]
MDAFASQSHAWSLDDIVFLPGSGSEKSPNLSCRITKNMKLGRPVMSGPSQISEEGMAMSLALEGGLGIIHRHMPIATQALKVRRVKQYHSGFILNPTCVAPKTTLQKARSIQAELGCSSLPVTENGRMGGRLVGLVTKRDLEGQQGNLQVASVMNRDVVFAQEPVTLKDACMHMQQAKVSKLPVLNKDMELVALLCRGDIKIAQQHPTASRDANRQLMVAAAVSAHEPDGWERVKAMVEAGADILSLDVDEGIDQYVVAFLKQMKDLFAGIDVIVGPVNCLSQATLLCEHGADAVRVGNAAGAEATTIYELSRTLRTTFGVPVIADVQARDSGQILKALLLGANAVCLDAMLGRCEEACGLHIMREGVRIRVEPQEGNRPVASGVPSTVVDRGSALTFLPFLFNQLRRSLQDLDIDSIGDISKALEQGKLRLEAQTPNFEASWQAPKMHPIIVGSLHSIP